MDHSESETQAERATNQLQSAASTGVTAWIDTQAEIFDHVDNVARRWIDRRREALDATRRSLDQLRQCENVGDLVHIQQDWFAGSMRRAFADLSDLTAATLGASKTAVWRVEKASQSMASDIAQAGHEAAQATSGEIETLTRRAKRESDAE